MALLFSNFFSLKHKRSAISIFVAISVCVIFFLYPHKGAQTFNILGLSMSPNYWPHQPLETAPVKTLTSGKVYVFSDQYYIEFLRKSGLSSPQSSLNPNRDVSVKRLVGMPGDTLEFDAHLKTLVRINGFDFSVQKIKKSRRHIVDGTISYIYEHKDGTDGYYVYQMKELPKELSVFAKNALKTDFLNSLEKTGDSRIVVHLNKGEYFMLSDNRTVGVDSRHYGPVKLSDIVGQVMSSPSPLLFSEKQ